MTKHHHIGLLQSAKEFTRCANKLNTGSQWSAAPLPVYYLFLHGAELALKSFYYLKAQNHKSLKRVGHNLSELINIVETHNIKDIYPEYQKLKDCLTVVSSIYNDKQLEYYKKTTLISLPTIGDISFACNSLELALDKYYRDKFKGSKWWN